MVKRPKHSYKEIEKLLRNLESQGWRVEMGSKHYLAKCPCGLKHMKSIACTPRSPHYLKNLLGAMRRETCWGEEEQ